MNRRTTALTASFAAGMILFAGAADAQMSNRPFSFGSPGGGLGMSLAGKQAIIDQKLFGSTPDNIMRGPGGQLLTVTPGPGDTAFATTRSGEILPVNPRRGFDKRLGAGQFNSFFVEFDGLPYQAYSEYGSTRATISAWTGSVLSGGPVGAGGGSVDQWTTMVYYMRGR